MWPVECGALGIFQRKGSFLEAAAKGEERRVRSRLLVPTLLLFSFSSVSITWSIFLRLSRLSLYLLFGSLTSGQSHLSFSPSSPKNLKFARCLADEVAFWRWNAQDLALR